ncbi:hypothetical protein ARMGADRAFT_285394 [Armillaria gallica]|uniref:Uncharacterized protein n=1 Tax=Armillaria gallica TaxID=47427 RepID=A0A2H3DHR9_ARMGA|nr:hypothetical protein ARMGADRAFT_285394 [Armillaria gallica]
MHLPLINSSGLMYRRSPWTGWPAASAGGGICSCVSCVTVSFIHVICDLSRVSLSKANPFLNPVIVSPLVQQTQQRWRKVYHPAVKQTLSVHSAILTLHRTPGTISVPTARLTAPKPLKSFREIFDAERDLARYQAELARLHDMVSRVEKQEAQVKKFISGYRSYLNSLVMRIPTEILLLIFQEVASWEADADFTTTLSISLVYSRWQNIALSAPSLWRNIYVGYGCSLDVNADLVRLYGERSGEELLHTIVNFKDGYDAISYASAIFALYSTSDR